MEIAVHGTNTEAPRHTHPNGSWARVKTILSRGGPYYFGLYVARSILERIGGFIDRRLVAVEQRKLIVAPWTIAARRHTADINKDLWNGYDWSKRGEEWTRTPEWKDKVLDQFLFPNVPEGATVVEIGPGGGRWTEVLQRRAKHLYVVDVSETVINLCRQRFRDCSNIEYRLGNGNTHDIPDATVEAIWSYDVFVHINPIDARTYLQEFSRLLVPGGRAVVHHPGSSKARKYREGAWRSDLTDKMVLQFAQESGLEVIFRTEELVNDGDVLSILRKPA